MASTHVINVNQQDWAQAVIARSADVPVVVDFWAAWCGPCRTLGPTLEKLAAEMNGAFVLAKVDVDRNQALAGQFGVQGIPAVKAFRNGTVVNEFTGALPESQVRAWLKQVVPNETDARATQALQLIAVDPAAAIGQLRAVLAAQPTHGPARLGLGKALLLTGADDAEPVLRAIPAGSLEYSQAQALLELGTLFQAASGSIGAARDRLAAKPDDSAARYDLAAHLARAQQWEDALRHLLLIVQRDRSFGNDAARRAMLAIFAVLGDTDLTTSQYRRQLASALF